MSMPKKVQPFSNKLLEQNGILAGRYHSTAVTALSGYFNIVLSEG